MSETVREVNLTPAFLDGLAAIHKRSDVANVPAETGIAQDAKVRKAQGGWDKGKMSSYPFLTSMSVLPCLMT